MSYHVQYHLINRKKYKGDANKIKCRSLWENSFCRWCDTNSKVVRWSFEEVRVKYYSKLDEKNRQYILDFWVKMDDNVEYLIEVKPKKQTKPPKKPKRMTKKGKVNFMNEIYNFGVNQDKWESANRFANSRGMKFVIMTEDRLTKLGIKIGK